MDWYLRPRHEGGDFAFLCGPVKNVFMVLSTQHKCMLWERTKTVVTDGKWGFQTPVCGDRSSMQIVRPSMETGFHCGCMQRPVRGSVWCKDHAGLEMVPVDECLIEDSRQVYRKNADGKDLCMVMQYKMRGKWQDTFEELCHKSGVGR